MRKRTNSRVGLFGVVWFTTVTVTGCCCWGDDGSAEKIAELERDVKTLEKNKKLKEAQIEQADDVLNRGTSASAVVFALHPDDVEKALKDAFPITFPANNLHEYVKGTVVVNGMRDIKIKGDDVSFELYGKGKKIHIDTYLGPYEKMAKEMIAGIEAGLVLEVNGKLSADKDGDLRFKGKVVSASLKKNNKDDYRSQIRSAVNKKFFKRAHIIDMSGLDGTKLKVASARGGRALLFYVK